MIPNPHIPTLQPVEVRRDDISLPLFMTECGDEGFNRPLLQIGDILYPVGEMSIGARYLVLWCAVSALLGIALGAVLCMVIR